jgi:hypothetical protein
MGQQQEPTEGLSESVGISFLSGGEDCQASNQMETACPFALAVAAMALGLQLLFLRDVFEWLTLHHWHESCQAQTAE